MPLKGALSQRTLMAPAAVQRASCPEGMVSAGLLSLTASLIWVIIEIKHGEHLKQFSRAKAFVGSHKRCSAAAV